MGIGRWLAVAPFALGASAWAGEEADLSARSKALAAKPVESPIATAPFVSRADSAALMFRPGAAALERSVPCAQAQVAVCLESRERALVYRGAKGYMPRFDGLTPEGVALRHDRLILRYSFR